ncbi:MAG: HlyD family efflux transporter periplasmic adaptor subunit [Burkholderiaceae bacterium]
MSSSDSTTAGKPSAAVAASGKTTQARADTPAAAPAAQQTPANAGKRRRLLLMIALVVVVLGIGYGVWYFLVGSHFESTDDAYVAGNVIQVTPQVAGTVIGIKADDTDIVQQGQDLVILDPSDSQVALDQAEAQLAQTVREVRTVYANNGTLSANIAMRQADTIKARSALVRAEDDFKRRSALVASGAVSKEELQHVQTELDSAKSALAAADAGVQASRERLASNQVSTDGTSVSRHPNVLRAAAKVREAYLAVERGTLPAPVTGQVAKRGVQLGQRVAPGTPLMAIVPLDQLWVDANFKEVQLRKMRIGQPVTLEADLYGGKVEYKGRIVGLSAGTGSAFSLLPAQNATGNWIKVVQRVPVRIEFDPKELAEHPLRIGLSIVARIDTSNQDGQQLAAAKRTEPSYQTQAFAPDTHAADAIIDRIVAANLGKTMDTARASGASEAVSSRKSAPARLARSN